MEFVDPGDHRFIEAGRHQIDHVHRLGELAMFLGRDFARNKDAEVTDAVVQAIDDRLTSFDDLVLVIVEIENPV